MRLNIAKSKGQSNWSVHIWESQYYIHTHTQIGGVHMHYGGGECIIAPGHAHLLAITISIGSTIFFINHISQFNIRKKKKKSWLFGTVKENTVMDDKNQ